VETDAGKWLRNSGIAFLKSIGVKEGQVVLDFGCGVGHYVIPAAKVVGEKGKVYALEKDSETLGKLTQTAKSEGLNNIMPIRTLEELKTHLNGESIDLVLLYDVLHYMDSKERRELYDNIHQFLRKDGILSVYPKHYESDDPCGNFSNLKLEDIIKEIESANFKLEKKSFRKLMHDENYDKGSVLKFGVR